MSEEMVYYCNECERIVPIGDGLGGTMDCCGRSMRKVPRKWCTSASVAEHARLDDEDEPCDI